MEKKLILVLFVFGFLISAATPLKAQVALRWNPVVIDTIAESTLVNVDDIQVAVEQMHTEFENQVYSGGVFERLESARQPDEVLIGITTITELSIEQWSSTDNLSYMIFFRMAANMKIVDPVSGQVVYSISDYHFREDWDHLGRDATSLDFNQRTMFKRDRNTSTLTRLDWQPGSSSRTEVTVTEIEVFSELIQLGIGSMIQQSKKEFRPERIEAAVAFVPKSLPGRRIRRNISTEPVVLNKGRMDGVFPEMVLYSEDQSALIRVIESYSNYSLGRIIAGSGVQQWDRFYSFKMDMGTPDAQALASVTRILFSDRLLNYEETQFLRDSENALQAEFGERTHSVLQIPAYHISYANIINSLAVQGGNIRVTYPLLGLVELDESKIDLMDIWQDLEMDAFRTYIRPDFGITAILSSLDRTEKEIPGGIQTTYSVQASVHLYDLRSGEIIVSGQSRRGRSFDRVSALGITVLQLDTPAVLINQIIRESLTDATSQMISNYNPSQVLAHASFSNAAAVSLSFDSEQGLHAGKRLRLSTHWMDIALDEGATVTTPIYRPRSELLLSQPSENGWEALAQVANLSLPEVDASYIELYGVNSIDDTLHPLGNPVSSIQVKSPILDQLETSEADLELMTMAYFAPFSNVSIRFPESLRQKLIEFNVQRYAFEPVFAEADRFAFDTASIEEQVYETLIKWPAIEEDGYTVTVTIPSARANRTGIDQYNRNKTLSIQMELQLGLLDENGRSIVKPVELNVNTQREVEPNELEGPAFVRQILYDYMPRVVEVLSKNRIKD